MNQPVLAFLLLTLSLPACGSVGPDAQDDSSADASPTDHTDDTDAAADPGDDSEAPAVLSVEPADGAAGVRPNQNITIVFDRPMDTDSVEAAWSSALLPADAVTFSWNGADDTLTVDPDDALPVAEGEGLDPDVVDPIAIVWSIGTAAADADGHALASTFQASFTTVRRMSAEVAINSPLTGSQESDGGSPPAGSDIVYAGDTSANLGVRVLVSFALPELPDGGELVTASLSAEQISATTNIFSVLGGGLEAVHVSFAQLNGAYGTPSLGSVGIFSDSSADGTRSVPVTAAVRGDLEDGAAYAQFRMQLPFATDSDGAYDTVQFTRSSFALSLVYLAD
jgi:hypothetical protein